MGDEVHHILPQQQADERGFIGHHHKNHPANLLNVCFECHDRIHGQNPVADLKVKSDALPPIPLKEQKQSFIHPHLAGIQPVVSGRVKTFKEFNMPN